MQLQITQQMDFHFAYIIILLLVFYFLLEVYWRVHVVQVQKHQQVYTVLSCIENCWNLFNFVCPSFIFTYLLLDI